MTISPGVTTDNPAQWLTLAKARGRRLQAAVEAGQARPHLLVLWRAEIAILKAEISRVSRAMELER